MVLWAHRGGDVGISLEGQTEFSRQETVQVRRVMGQDQAKELTLA